MGKIEQVWDEYYNYSSMREALFWWYDFKENASILEWCPEKGALSGWLAEHSKELTCVVSDVSQKEYLRKRFIARENIEFISQEDVCNAEEKKYDYVIAINPFHTDDTKDKIKEIYALWKKRLSKDGKLIYVINNSLSINNRIGIKNVRGKEQDRMRLRGDLEQLFPNVQFYYLFSDFVFPQMVYSDRYLPSYEVAERIMPYARNNDRLEEDGYEIYKMAANNNMLSQMANSFFIECGDAFQRCQTIGATMTADRGRFSLVTRIDERGYVEKFSIDKENVEQIITLNENMKKLSSRKIGVIPFEFQENTIKMPYIKAPVLTAYLKSVIQRSTDEFLELFADFYQNILMSSRQTGIVAEELQEQYGDVVWGPILEETYVEMTPLNCFYTENGFRFFDQEYMLEKYPAKYVLFRSLAHLYYFDDIFEKYVPLEYMKTKYELQEVWEYFEAMEEKFLQKVRGKDERNIFYNAHWISNAYKYMGDNPRWEKITYYLRGAENKKIVLWGTGNFFQVFMDRYETKIKVDFAVDCDSELWGISRRGIEIKNPEELLKENVRVIITCNAADEVIKQLDKLAIEDYKIFLIEEDNVW